MNNIIIKKLKKYRKEKLHLNHINLELLKS